MTSKIKWKVIPDLKDSSEFLFALKEPILEKITLKRESTNPL
jgi:hypothetical protein